MIDTGIEKKGVEVGNLRLLKKDLLKFPIMAIPMRLSGLERPDTKEWGQDCLRYFEALFEGKSVRISVDKRLDDHRNHKKVYSVTAYLVMSGMVNNASFSVHFFPPLFTETTQLEKQLTMSSYL